jgi:hypothetical protein
MFENVQGYYHISAILLAPQNLVKFFFFFFFFLRIILLSFIRRISFRSDFIFSFFL